MSIRYVIPLLLSAVVCQGAAAQNLNQRDTADPAANAKVSRALTDARSKAAQAGDLTLNDETVFTECEPVELGNVTSENSEDEKGRPRIRGRDERGNPKIRGRKEEVVVVPGDVINICR